MNSQRILVIDDEKDLCDIIVFNLTTAGYQADAVYNAEEALKQDLNSYDLLLVDVMMDGLSGFELAERLKDNRQTASIPIIFLTAKDSEEDMLHGFDIGGDDYVTKPFSVRELLARIKAVLNRMAPAEADESSILSHESLVMNIDHKAVYVDNRQIALTKTEFEVLRLLLSHPHEVFSRQQVIDAAWPRNVVVNDRTVDVNIARMRKKIGPYSSLIVTRQGYGYVFEP